VIQQHAGPEHAIASDNVDVTIQFVPRIPAPFRKLNGFEAGPVMNAPLYPDVAFCVVMSSCAARDWPAAIANTKSKTGIDCRNRCRAAGISG
jgi:hypothetical protein